MQKGRKQEEVIRLDVEDILHGISFGQPFYRKDVNKISFVLDSYHDHLDSKEGFPHLEAYTWGGRGEQALLEDFGVKDCDKSKGIQ